MLQLLRQRCESATPDPTQRLRTHQANALTIPLEAKYDLIVTHFFLDCLTQPELDPSSPASQNTCSPEPSGSSPTSASPPPSQSSPPSSSSAALYLAFRILTNLRTTTLPDHATPLSNPA